METQEEKEVGESKEGPGLAGLMIGMGVFVIIGVPMVFYIWRFINDLLMGQVVASNTLIALVLLVVFVLYIRIVARQVRKWETEPESPT